MSALGIIVALEIHVCDRCRCQEHLIAAIPLKGRIQEREGLVVAVRCLNSQLAALMGSIAHQTLSFGRAAWDLRV
jgi:hypothetical protein